MAEKKQTGFIKLQNLAGAANWAPPVGPALGAQGVNIMQFCQAFNAQTQDQSGTIIPVEITVHEMCRSRSCAHLAGAILYRAQSQASAAPGLPHRSRQPGVGTLTEDQLREIAEIKMPDLNANTIEAAMEIIAGTARSMGVRIEGREMKIKYVPSKKVAAMLQGKTLED